MAVRHVAIPLGLAIIAGAALNLAIAWRIAAQRMQLGVGDDSFFSDNSPCKWYFKTKEEPHRTFLLSAPYRFGDFNWSQRSPPHWSTIAKARPSMATVEGSSVPNFRLEVATGWPFLAFTGRADVNPKTCAVTPHGAFLFQDSARFWPLTRLLPYKPIAIPFLANTSVLAAPVFLTIILSRVALRLLRSYRGLCRRCAYPLTGSPICPESGAPLGAA